MRIFIAIECDLAVKQKLAAMQDLVKPFVEKGRFSRIENFHLTVRFLGERQPKETKEILDCMQCVAERTMPFELKTDGLGCFHKKRDICYAAVQENIVLTNVFRKLQEELWTEGLIREKQAYTPHITLARDVVWTTEPNQIQEFNQLEQIQLNACGLSLMESTRVDGVLCYLPLAYQGFAAKEES